MQHEVYRHTKIPITVLREFLCSAYNLVLASSTWVIKYTCDPHALVAVMQKVHLWSTLEAICHCLSLALFVKADHVSVQLFTSAVFLLSRQVIREHRHQLP